jgi:WhiB family redox-sensing transcriptional regulator
MMRPFRTEKATDRTLPRPAEWKLRGSCVTFPEVDLWFSEDRSEIAYAVAICQRCPVKDACLTEALTNRLDHGVWGGTTGGDRERIRTKARRKKLT